MLWLVVVEWAARLILVLLVALSIWSISIIIERRRFFKNLVLAQYFSSFTSELPKLKSPQQVDRAFDAWVVEKRKELEKGIPVLGTLGSTSPFVGLLGTILGIIVSFGELSRGAGSTNTVMFSLAEALILTAVGLLVAIPATVAFNYFNRQVKLVISEGSVLKDSYLAYKD